MHITHIYIYKVGLHLCLQGASQSGQGGAQQDGSHCIQEFCDWGLHVKGERCIHDVGFFMQHLIIQCMLHVLIFVGGNKKIMLSLHCGVSVNQA